MLIGTFVPSIIGAFVPSIIEALFPHRVRDGINVRSGSFFWGGNLPGGNSPCTIFRVWFYFDPTIFGQLGCWTKDLSDKWGGPVPPTPEASAPLQQNCLNILFSLRSLIKQPHSCNAMTPDVGKNSRFILADKLMTSISINRIRLNRSWWSERAPPSFITLGQPRFQGLVR